MLRSVAFYAYLAFATVWLTVSICLAIGWADNTAAITGIAAGIYLGGAMGVSALVLVAALVLQATLGTGKPNVTTDNVAA